MSVNENSMSSRGVPPQILWGTPEMAAYAIEQYGLKDSKSEYRKIRDYIKKEVEKHPYYSRERKGDPNHKRSGWLMPEEARHFINTIAGDLVRLYGKGDQSAPLPKFSGASKRAVIERRTRLCVEQQKAYEFEENSIPSGDYEDLVPDDPYDGPHPYEPIDTENPLDVGRVLCSLCSGWPVDGIAYDGERKYQYFENGEEPTPIKVFTDVRCGYDRVLEVMLLAIMKRLGINFDSDSLAQDVAFLQVAQKNRGAYSQDWMMGDIQEAPGHEEVREAQMQIAKANLAQPLEAYATSRLDDLALFVAKKLMKQSKSCINLGELKKGAALGLAVSVGEANSDTPDELVKVCLSKINKAIEKLDKLE